MIGFIVEDMSSNNTSYIRGLGTLSRIVGPNVRLVDLSDSEKAGQGAREESAAQTVSWDGYQCPICWKEFDGDSSELVMSEHVEICLTRSHQSRPKKQRSLLHTMTRSCDSTVVQNGKANFSDQANLLDGRDVSVEPQPAGNDGMSFETQIVGRRFCGKHAVNKGDEFKLVWDKDNRYDPNATLAVAWDGTGSLGYVPQVVAAKLGPLLKAGIVQGGGILLHEPLGIKNVSVRISLSFVKAPSSFGSKDDCIKELAEVAEIHRLDKDSSVYSARLLQRVHQILDVVEKIESKALGDKDKRFKVLFQSQGSTGQILFASLAQKQKTYFSIHFLENRYSKDVTASLRELCDHGLLAVVHMKESLSSGANNAPSRDAETIKSILCDVFQKKELIDIIEEIKGSNFEAEALMHDVSSKRLRSKKKDELIGYVVSCLTSKHSESRDATLKVILNVAGDIFEVSKEYRQSFHRIQRLFFLNEGHSLGTWEAVESGHIRYPSYAITREQEVFPNRKLFLDYERSLFAAERLVHAIQVCHQHILHLSSGLHHMALFFQEQDFKSIEYHLAPAWELLDRQENKMSDSNGLQPPFYMQYHSKWIYCIMATVGVGILERKKEYKLAIERLQQLLGGIYCKERRGYWWIRLSINLEHIGRPTDSLEIAETALADPSVRPDERLTLQRRIIKLAKPPRRWKKPSWAKLMPKDPNVLVIEGNPLENTRGGKSRFLGYDSCVCSVEQLALQYYASDEGGCYQGIHSEGGIWCTIFSLLLWPALFQPLPNVFRTPFQTAPLDLGFPGFYESRKSTIDQILHDVRQGNGPFLVERCWRDNYGVTVRGISWEKYDLATIQSIISCVGGAGIAAVCSLMCEDYSSWTGGMPDLLLWRPETQSAKLSEVKGPRDTLSDKQRAWISFLETSGIDVEVLKVKEPPKNKRKMKFSL